MNELFWVFFWAALGSIAFVSIQTMTIIFLIKWNNELRAEVEALQPPF